MRDIKMFAGSVVAINHIQSVDNGADISFVRNSTVNSRVSVSLANGNTISFPQGAEVRVRTLDSARFENVAVDALTDQHAFMLPQRRFEALKGKKDILDTYKFTRDSTFVDLAETSQESFNRYILQRLETTEGNDDGIAHIANGLYIKCEDLWEVMGAATLIGLHGITTYRHPNTPILYVDLGRPSCFISKLASGVFSGPATQIVIEEFYAHDVFRLPEAMTNYFMDDVMAFGTIYEGMSIDNMVPVLSVETHLLSTPRETVTFDVASDERVDTAWVQI